MNEGCVKNSRLYIFTFRDMNRQRALRSDRARSCRFIALNDSASRKMVIKIYFNFLRFSSKVLELFECRRCDPFMTGVRIRCGRVIRCILTRIARAIIAKKNLLKWVYFLDILTRIARAIFVKIPAEMVAFRLCCQFFFSLIISQRSVHLFFLRRWIWPDLPATVS